MAHIEIWYRCPLCKRAYYTEREAGICRNKHPVITERRAVGKGGKSVRIDRPGQEAQALREADLSDLIEERQRQLKKIQDEPKGKERLRK